MAAKLIGNVFKSLYRGGEHLTDSLLRDMEPAKAHRIGRVVDAGAGALVTYMSAAGIVGNVMAVATIASAAAFVSAPVMAVTLASAALFGTLNVLAATFGLGLLGAAAQKFGVMSPREVARRAARETVRPLAWTARKLRHPFQKAHDGQTARKAARQKPAPRATVKHKL